MEFSECLKCWKQIYPMIKHLIHISLCVHKANLERMSYLVVRLEKHNSIWIKVNMRYSGKSCTVMKIEDKVQQFEKLIDPFFNPNNIRFNIFRVGIWGWFAYYSILTSFPVSFFTILRYFSRLCSRHIHTC